MNKPFMLYFGPWDVAGHYLFTEQKRHVWDPPRMPWTGGEIDCGLQPGCKGRKSWQIPAEEQVEGEALLHHKDGWTALSFWDRTVDTRIGCNSTYIAEGTFTFEAMVELAKSRFAERWNTMQFTVTLVAQN